MGKVIGVANQAESLNVFAHGCTVWNFTSSWYPVTKSAPPHSIREHHKGSVLASNGRGWELTNLEALQHEDTTLFFKKKMDQQNLRH